MAGGAASYLSRGGMATKVSAAKMATQGGTDLIIASGLTQNPLAKLGEGARFTLFSAKNTAEPARKIWIANHMDICAKIVIDKGAEKALKAGRSLLAAGVVHIEGECERGDPVAILTMNKQHIATGLINYSHKDAEKIIGKRSEEIIDILGHAPRSAFIHRDDLAFI